MRPRIPSSRMTAIKTMGRIHTRLLVGWGQPACEGVRLILRIHGSLVPRLSPHTLMTKGPSSSCGGEPGNEASEWVKEWTNANNWVHTDVYDNIVRQYIVWTDMSFWLHAQIPNAIHNVKVDCHIHTHTFFHFHKDWYFIWCNKEHMFTSLVVHKYTLHFIDT